jgi:hypothetical protein
MGKGRGKKTMTGIVVPELVIEIYLKMLNLGLSDGAGNIEVMIRLKKVFNSVYAIDNPGDENSCNASFL